MLFIQQISVLSLFITAALAAALPQGTPSKKEIARQRIAERQYKPNARPAGVRRWSQPQPSTAPCDGYINFWGKCVPKCQQTNVSYCQSEQGGCECSAGYTDVSPWGCVKTCQPNYTRSSDGSCTCNTSQYDLLSDGSCVSKCSSNQQRFGDQCVAKCPTGQQLNQNGNCVSACPSGQHIDAWGNCVTQCPSGQELWQGSCVNQCTNGTSRGSDGQCNQCTGSSNVLSQIISATTGLSSPCCVSKCLLPYPLYQQNPQGGCIGTFGASCLGGNVQCASGLRCSSSLHTCIL